MMNKFLYDTSKEYQKCYVKYDDYEENKDSNSKIIAMIIK